MRTKTFFERCDIDRGNNFEKMGISIDGFHHLWPKFITRWSREGFIRFRELRREAVDNVLGGPQESTLKGTLPWFEPRQV
jgi:hypothetical protein